MRYLTLLVALLLCAVASTSVGLDAPWPVTVVGVGAFLLFTPGLLVVHVVELPDRLLALVVGMLVGPCLWVLVGTAQLFAGLWAPRTTVLVAAGLLGVVTLLLALRGVRREAGPAPLLPPVAPASRIEEYAVDEPD